MKELSDLFPTEKEVEIGKCKVKIKNIALGDIPVVAEIVGKAMGLFSVKGKDELVIKKDELITHLHHPPHRRRLPRLLLLPHDLQRHADEPASKDLPASAPRAPQRDLPLRGLGDDASRFAGLRCAR